MYLTKIFHGWWLGCVYDCVMCVENRALGVSDQDYPRVCASVYCLMGAEPLVYLTEIIPGLSACVLVCSCVKGAEPCVNLKKTIQGLMAGVRVCCCVLCVGGRALGVSDQDYPRVCAAVCCVLEAELLMYLT